MRFQLWKCGSAQRCEKLRAGVGRGIELPVWIVAGRVNGTSKGPVVCVCAHKEKSA